MSVLNDLLVESKVFANREVLSPHYIPKKLIARDREINSIEKAIAPSLKGERGRNLFVYGKTGAGKTSCIKYVINEVNNIPNTRARISYVNCRIYNSRYRVFSKIISDHLPTYAKRGYGVVDLYEKLTGWIEEDGKTLIVVLDEIDVVKDLDNLIYALTRINSEIKAGGVSMVGISNTVSFKESLDPRSLSSLYETELVFTPYNANELFEILLDRSTTGLRPGAVNEDVLRYIAAAATKDGGDARFSLNVLSRAGEITEEKNSDRITLEDAQHAIKFAEDDIVYEVISTLPEHQKLVLYSIAMLTKSGGTYKKLTDGVDTYLFSGEVYSRYKSITESLKKEPKGERWYRKYLSELQMQGLIETFESGRGIRGHTKLIKLAYPADRTKEVLEKDLFGVNVR
ncbi:MAG: AAA family ATPase [Candidatus Marsarchaeota archaeon]|jgi:cell division control protein 6|nr:AAA family ATPase [Candidatus Marsarchaeota archaeon]MCL5430836.1 AAA family ATPase [Candidatus Marsarchaeota archaeon]